MEISQGFIFYIVDFFNILELKLTILVPNKFLVFTAVTLESVDCFESDLNKYLALCS